MSAGCSRASVRSSCALFCRATELCVELVARRVRRVLELLVDQPFDEPVLAQQRRDFGERVLHAFARLGALAPPGRRGCRTWAVAGQRGRIRAIAIEDAALRRDSRVIASTPRLIYGNSAAGMRARMMRILRFRPGAPWLRS